MIQLFFIPLGVILVKLLLDGYVTVTANTHIDQGKVTVPTGVSRENALRAIRAGYFCTLVSSIIILVGMYITSKNLVVANLDIVTLVFLYFLMYSGLQTVTKTMFTLFVYIRAWIKK